MHILRSKLIAIVLVLLFAVPLFGQTPYEYPGKTGQTRFTVKWDPVPGATYYEVVTIRGTVRSVAAKTTGTSYTLTFRHAGRYVVEVKACNASGCSGPARSDDSRYATVGGAARAWVLVVRLAGPTNPTITPLQMR